MDINDPLETATLSMDDLSTADSPIDILSASNASRTTLEYDEVDLCDDFNVAAFERLRWAIFDPSGTAAIRVLDDADSKNPIVTPFSDNHDLASQYATKTLAKKIVFFIRALGEYESEWDDAFDFVDPHPEPDRLEDCWDAMVVQHKDNEPLTVEDVVIQLQAHFDRPFIRKRTREALAWMYNAGSGHIDENGNDIVDYEGHSEMFVPDDVNIFLECLDPHGIDIEEGLHSVYIDLWVEGELGVNAEQYWAERIS